jgi:hypothetical protein
MKKVLLALGIVLAVLPACDTSEVDCSNPENYCECNPENCNVVGDEPEGGPSVEAAVPLPPPVAR